MELMNKRFIEEIKKYQLNIKKNIKKIPQKFIYKVDLYNDFTNKKICGLSVNFFNKKRNKKPKDKNLNYVPNDLLFTFYIYYDYGEEIFIIKETIYRYWNGYFDFQTYLDLHCPYRKKNEIKKALDYFEKKVFKWNIGYEIKDFYFKKMPDDFEL